MNMNLYEVVKVINGHEILRMKGMRSFYHVIIKKTNKGYVEQTFRTQKAATAFCMTLN